MSVNLVGVAELSRTIAGGGHDLRAVAAIADHSPAAAHAITDLASTAIGAHPLTHALDGVVAGVAELDRARSPLAAPAATSATAAASRPAVTDAVAAGPIADAVAGAASKRWYQKSTIYQVNVRSFMDSNGDGIGDFKGLTSKLDHIKSLGVDSVWVMPFTNSPMRDGGYDIANYVGIHKDFGTMEDFQQFVDEAHKRKLKVITELVLNHTSVDHPWFQRARLAPAGSVERDFYVWSDNPAKYKEAQVNFKDFEKSNWEWDPVAKSNYWHRFYAHQPDLNWDNPAVVTEMNKVVDFWLGKGVDGLRLDAVPFLAEREGTNGESLKETHDILKAMRAHVDANFPDRMLLGEANRFPKDTIEYFGKGDELTNLYNFPLMMASFKAAVTQDSAPIVQALEATRDIPDSVGWATFLRNHDELTVEMLGEHDRDLLLRELAPDMQSRVNMGIKRRLAPLMGNDTRRIEMMNSMHFSLPGSPILYNGDEIGMGDNVLLRDRDSVRTPMQWTAGRNGGFSTADASKLYMPVVADPAYAPAAVNVEQQQRDANSLLSRMKSLISTRNAHPALTSGRVSIIPTSNPKVLAFVRSGEGENVLSIVNLAKTREAVSLDLRGFDHASAVSLQGSGTLPVLSAGVPAQLTLGPYDYHWLGLEPARAI